MRTETLKFETPNGATSAFVARPSDADDGSIREAATIILIHEWWGINDHIRDIAGRYAKENFLCVAPDLYRGVTARDPQEAAKLMQALSAEDGLATISGASDETKRAYGVRQIGITGFCMGGTFALRAACDMKSLSAAAPFYGDIPDDSVLAHLQTPTLFIASARDNWITPEKVEGLKASARQYDLPVQVISYDADHAFFNDTRPEVYNAEAANDAWRRVLAFFRERLCTEDVSHGAAGKIS